MTLLRSIRLQRAQRIRQGALVLIAVLVCGLFAGSPLATAQGTGQVDVTITSISPQVATPQSPVVVEALITNPTSQELTTTVTLGISRVILQSREQIDRWMATADDGDAGSELTSELMTLGAGKEATVRLTVEPGKLGLSTSSYGMGPRGISVTVTGSATDVADAQPAANGRLGIERTFLVWQPQPNYAVPVVDVAVAVPITGSLSDVIEETEESGRLNRVVASTAAHPEVSWLIDPALVAAAAGTLPATAIQNPAAAATDATKQWAATVQSEAGLHSGYALEPFDADVAVISARDDVPALSEDTAATLADITQYWDTGIALPWESSPRQSAIESAWSTGSGTVIAQRNYQASGADEVSPGGVTTVEHTHGRSTVLVSDPNLSKLLTDGQSGSPATTAQEILAELAVIARADPDARRNVLITLPRTWEPDVATVTAQLAALESAAFINFISLDELEAIGDDGTARSTPAGSISSAESRLTAQEWSALVDLAKTTSTFAQIADDPAAISGPITDAVWQLASVSWLDDPPARSALAQGLNEQVDDLLASQSVVLGSDVNLIAASGALPITVANSLDQAVTIGVRLAPDHPRLKSEDIDPVKVGPNSEISVEIPVTAVGSGDVDVRVRLLSTDGTVVSTPASFTVRVRADWESGVTITIGALLSLMLIAGIWRTIKRGRANTRTAQGPTPEEN